MVVAMLLVLGFNRLDSCLDADCGEATVIADRLNQHDLCRAHHAPRKGDLGNHWIEKEFRKTSYRFSRYSGMPKCANRRRSKQFGG